MWADLWSAKFLPDFTLRTFLRAEKRAGQHLATHVLPLIDQLFFETYRKLAVTVVSALIVTAHVSEVPAQPPAQPTTARLRLESPSV